MGIFVLRQIFCDLERKIPLFFGAKSPKRFFEIFGFLWEGGNRKIVKSSIFLNIQRKVGLLQIDTQSVKLVGFVSFLD